MEKQEIRAGRIGLFSVLLAIIFCITGVSAAAEPVIANHTRTHLSAVPLSAINAAKEDLHIAYWHTSHGSQITTGMTGLTTFAGAPYAGSNYAYNSGGSGGALDLREPASVDLGTSSWPSITRSYLASHPEVNVVMWSWCGQVSSASQSSISTYLSQMNQLESEYPNVKFVYMTGHLDGGGSSGNLNQRNEQIRAYARTNNKILYDFADIESFDPSGNTNYMTLYANDACDYSGGNWATAWQNSHTQGTDWYSCTAAHTQPLNANQKAYAAWWLWAQLGGGTGSLKPVASFSTDVTSGTAPLPVHFTDNSANSPTAWNWSFGDGSPVNATEQNPVHIYSFPGIYTVSLNASNAEGSDIKTQAGYVIVNPSTPVADFTATPRSGGVPLTVFFTDTSTDSPVSWDWSFGDGSPVNATEQNPVHTYSSPGTYTISLKTSNAGGSDLKTSAGYITVFSRPDVTAISPVSGPVAGGALVTITGTGFTGAEEIRFGNRVAGNVTVISDTRITVTSPILAAGTVYVSVTTPGGTSANATASRFTYVARPNITAVSPSRGSVAGGTRITLTGTRFTGATAVRFGGVAGTGMIVVSGNRITVRSPSHGAGTVNVTVTTPNGTNVPAAAAKFTYIPRPMVTAISPASGPVAGGTRGTLTGTGFTGATAVRFGNRAAGNMTVISDTRITVTSPVRTPGALFVSVTTAGGTSANATASRFTYLA